MGNSGFELRLRRWSEARGYGLAIADTGVVETVRKKLEERRSSGQIDPGFFEENLTGFRYPEEASITGSASWSSPFRPRSASCP
jgi:hypothetical protein